ncbi:hypothetical protein [Mycolicibacterium fortuitum]
MGETAALLAALQRHYIKPGDIVTGGVFLAEVGQNGGHSWPAVRRCDALYVGFTSASGRILVGHELKVSRADWLSELKKVGKADAWADECHEWWLVVSDPGIVHDGELPDGWGLMSPGRAGSSRMKVHVKAARKDPASHRPGWDAVRSIMAAYDTRRAQAMTEFWSTAVSEASAQANAKVQQRIDHAVSQAMSAIPDTAELLARIERIEQALGAQIDWQATSAGTARGGRVGLADIAQIADAVRSCGDVRRAAWNLAEGYRNPVRETLLAVEQLDQALSQLRDVMAGSAALGEDRTGRKICDAARP